MKKKFTPEIAYILGMWHAKKLPDGVGIYGDKGEFFLELVDKYLHPVEKRTLFKGKFPVFYHNRVENYLKRLEKDRIHRLKYHNDYSAAYFAGMFEAGGSQVENTVLLQGDKIDELLLTHLGFFPFRKEGFIIPRKSQAFLRYIQDWLLASKASKE
ncbi:MAG: hypothetical protein GXN92_00940 [Candidatus Micrarchaeota archaeon]|nr:hypothetical protein [Candidatus Micrarchaeota archaeon]